MAVVYYNREEVCNSADFSVRLLYVSRAMNESALVPTLFHAHEKNLELQFIFDGRASICIGNHVHNVRRGDIVVYNAGVLHDECPDVNRGVSFYNCGLKNVRVGNLPENHLLPEDVLPVLQAGNATDFVETVFRELVEQISLKKAAGTTVCRHLINALLTVLLEQIPHKKITRDARWDASLLQSKKFIDEHFTETLSVEQMSKIANMSISGFAHRFKSFLGLAPLKYLTRLRIGLAQNLLISTDKTIADVATEVGYDTIGHFNNQFKNFVGVSPKNYRKLWIGGN